MWSVTNETPYAAEGSWGRDKDGIHEWIVAVRATFDVQANGTLTLADEQSEPLLTPEYHGEPGRSSLRFDADFAARKPTTDIVLNGTAYAPGGQPTKEFLISLQVGDVQKQLKVVGNRVRRRGLFSGISAVEPVTEVPVVYERAFGGFSDPDAEPARQQMDSRNPVGCGLSLDDGQPLPNFEYPGGNIEKDGPAGFGALASYWSPRLEMQGTYDDAWEQSRCPLMPTDWHPESLLCAPRDQRPAQHLVGGEPVELRNLTRTGLLQFLLPEVQLRFRTVFAMRTGTDIREHEGRLATVILEPDLPRVTMVWESALTCRSDGDYLEETIVEEGSSN